MHLLIPYTYQRHHLDPVLADFTYGDSDSRARKLKRDLKPGNFVFFHTTAGGKKCITAYFVVNRVMDTVSACQNQEIRDKYAGHPHISECLEGKRCQTGEDDVVLFGDPITSRVLVRPLPFDRSLAERLSLRIKFTPGRRDSQVIGSATRQWRELSDKDCDVIRKAIRAAEQLSISKNLRTSEEVAEMIEKHIEDHLAADPTLIGKVIDKNLKLVDRQRRLATEKERIDLLYEDPQGNWVVVEVKVGQVGHDAMHQVKSYMRDLRKSNPGKKVRGILVCSGVMPAFEDEFQKQTKIAVVIYGWRMEVQPW